MTAAAPPISIALIGSGLIGPRHAQSILRNPQTVLHSLTDPAPHAIEIAKSLSTPYHDAISSLLSSAPLPTAVLICTPNSTHVPISISCIEAGIKYVLVEKPISTSIQEGIKLLSAAEEKGAVILVGHHRRFNPYLISTKAELDSGKLGRVIAVQGIWALKKPQSYFSGIGEWRRNGESGGVVLINLIHEVDLLQYLLGKVVAVSAFESEKTRGYDAEEGCAVILRFETGVVGTFLLSDAVPSPWNFEAGTGENPNIPKVGQEDGPGGFYRILGTNGSVSVPDMARFSYEDGKGESAWNDVLKREEIQVNEKIVPFDEQIESLVQVVKEGKEPVCSGEEGLSAMIVCEAVRRSMKYGETVRIDGLHIAGEKN
ncbi:quinate utilization oxidoreductase protein [Rutstroemia sp. NJR-2017a WRK4]|nr:quinate utilization oxidoreductase protein [Rutstroemia sp. NJR-2017a WRK4]